MGACSGHSCALVDDGAVNDGGGSTIRTDGGTCDGYCEALLGDNGGY